ncbi:MAG: hypothetical protein KBB95_28465 [Deltaproteobacteria bacterium]|nr:hypothetical protein [Deltaproteobacteria bacterium]
MSVDWRESPTEAWRRATRRAGWRRAKAMLAAASAYAATLAAIVGGWELYQELRYVLRGPLELFLVFAIFLLVFGPPALAARAAYMRVMNSTPTVSSAPPPHRPTTF